MQRIGWYRQRGYTLTELLIVIALLGVVATVAIPAPQPISDAVLESSATKAANLVRLARELSMTRNRDFGIAVDPEAQTLRVFSTERPFSEEAIRSFDVIDPITRQPARLDFSSSTGAEAIRIAEVSFDRPALRSVDSSLAFALDGVPILRTNGDVDQRTTMTLSSGLRERTIIVSRATGRVVVR